VEIGSSDIPVMDRTLESGGSGPGTSFQGAHGVLTPTEFAAKYRECSRLLWCIAQGVVNDRTLADDVVQEAAMVALGKLEQFDPATSFPAWAGQVVRFTALNMGRKVQRERKLLNEMHQATPGDGSYGGRGDPAVGAAAAGVDSRGGVVPGGDAFDDEVQEALAGLDETARACLLMKTTLDMAYTDIARALNIPEGTAMSHVHRARKALRERLLAKGYAGGPAR
jgi:RNA polymerase sigma-70 factor (ECF subfamily)